MKLVLFRGLNITLVDKKAYWPDYVCFLHSKFIEADAFVKQGIAMNQFGMKLMLRKKCQKHLYRMCIWT